MKKIENIMEIIKKYSNELFFYIPMIIFVSSSYFRTFQNIFNYFEIIATLLLATGIALNLKKVSKKEFKRMILIGAIFFIVFFICRDITVIKFLLFIMAAYNINFNKSVKIDFYVRLICLILVLILNSVGIIPSVDITRGSIQRYSFGFAHPNTFAYKVLILLFEYFYLNKFKSVGINTVITIAIVFFLNYYTNSRTAEMLILFVFIVGTILNKIKNIPPLITKILQHFTSYSYFYFALIIFISFLLYRYDNEIGYKINKLLSTRLYFINKYYDKYGVTLFGNNFTGFVSTSNSLDVGFAHVLFRYGIIAFFLMGIGFRNVFKILFDKKNISYIVILFAFIIYMITENSIIRIEQNIFMIIFCLLIKDRKEDFFAK